MVDRSNYRTILGLSDISKIHGRVIAEQLTNYLEKHHPAEVAIARLTWIE